MNRINFGPGCLDITEKEHIEGIIRNLINKNIPAQIVTLNALMYNRAVKDKILSKTIQDAAFVIPDSIGIVWSVHYLFGKKISRFAGIDIIEDICNLSNENGYKIFLLGSKTDILEKASKSLLIKYPDLKISGIHHGYFKKEDEEKVIEEIKKSAADILLVALDVPRQEIWISKNLNRFGIKLAMGVGGSFDVLSGSLKRAPRLMQIVGLEWFFRLIQQPKRFFRILGLFVFVSNIIKLKITNNQETITKQLPNSKV
ncbi:MAG: WecB/TagA/CpsF family glycosyltransferase [Elusimicrobia bacterium]|nr:WecB/TagA/CpsF family glycosyltransferase [Candidatus Liberimonas magnetica]